MSPSPSPQRSSVSAVRPAPYKIPALPQLSLGKLAPLALVTMHHTTTTAATGAQTARLPVSSNEETKKFVAPLNQLFRPVAVPAKSSPRNQFYRVNMLTTGSTGQQQQQYYSAAHTHLLGGASDAISISSTISCVSGKSPSRRPHHQQYQSARELDEDRAAVYALSRHAPPPPTSHSQSPPTLALDQPPRVSPTNGKAKGFLPSIGKNVNDMLQIPAPPGAITRRSPREVQLTLPSIFSNGTSTTPRSHDGSNATTTTTDASDHHQPPSTSLNGTQNGSASSFVDSNSDDEDDRPHRGGGSTRNHHTNAASSVTSANSSIGERRLSRISEGQIHATKKATARVLKMMSSINISKSSRMIAVFKEFDPNLVARYLHKHCRLCRQLLTKEEFYVLVRSIVSDLRNAVLGSADSDDLATATTAVSSRRGSRSSAETTSTTSAMAFRQRSFSKTSDDGKSFSAAAAQSQQLQQLLRRDDTDPIFTLLDEEELGVLDTRHVRSRFFTVALASPSDILARVIRMVFSSSAYYVLESTISRFELQMMSDLLHEELLGAAIPPSDGEDSSSISATVPHEVLEKMHQRDREALIAHETAREELRRVEKQNKAIESGSSSGAGASGGASGKNRSGSSTVIDAQDDDEDDDAICIRLRDAVYEPEEARKVRLLKMFSAIREMPNLLNNAPRGCVTVRHLRGMCQELRFHIMGEVDVPPSQESGWSRRRETVVTQRLRYDEAYATLATYLFLSPPAPTNIATASVPTTSRAALLATAAASFISKSFDVTKGSKPQQQRQYEEGEDPILAEAVEDYQIIQEVASRRQRSDSMVLLPQRPLPNSIGVTVAGNGTSSTQSHLAARLLSRKQQQQQQNNSSSFNLASSNGSPAGMSSNNLATFDHMSMMNSMLMSEQTTPRRGKNEQLAAMASQADLFRRLSASGNSTTGGSTTGKEVDLGLEHHRTDSFTASPTSPILPVAAAAVGLGGGSGELSSLPNSPQIRISVGSTSSPLHHSKGGGGTSALGPPQQQQQRRLSKASNNNNNNQIKRKGAAAASTTSPSTTLLLPATGSGAPHSASISARTSSSYYIDEQQYNLDFPPEHGNPIYASREGIVYKHSDRCPQGRPVAHDLWV
ncbi:Hypothetical protein, putative [Bodo saltans]|uniref:Uncharacterized protein n=1 Tax=Bodo saltans TaxID=75058 RepID=A0A0S4JPV2_BODSA|nr:Hypothetical protein, putative [Bodo saltans]|eukprot:CUG92221.1 Hypothetical protein, putative [Bodo saltans]